MTLYPTSSPLIWHDVDKFNQRLQTFHPNASCTSLLPVEISPIQCARFGWYRVALNSNNENGNTSADVGKVHGNSTDGGILLECQDCHAAMCIKFHPLLSRQSKRRLTLTYRQMLASSHKQGCNFKYDALSWLTKSNIQHQHDSSNPNMNIEKEEKEQRQKEGGGMDIEYNVVPPYLLHLSNEYQMLQNNYSIRQPQRQNSTPAEDTNANLSQNEIVLTTSTSNTFQFIHNECLRFGKFVNAINCNSSKEIIEIKDSTDDSDKEDVDQNEKLPESLSYLDNQIIDQMVKIAFSSFPSLLLQSGNKNRFEQTRGMNSSTSHDQQREHLVKILEKIIHTMNMKTTEICQNNAFTNNNSTTNTELNKRYSTSTTSTMFGKLKSLQNIVLHGKRNNDDSDEVRDDTKLYDDAESSTWIKNVTKEILLLSIFGWRVVSFNEVESQPSTNIASNAKGMAPSPSKNDRIYGKCPFCKNCVPLSATQINGVQNDYDELNENDISSSTSPQQKKRRIDTSGRVQGDSKIHMRDSITLEKEHNFHVIKSHRYYCPFANGFQQSTMNEENDAQVNDIMLQKDDTFFGISIPLWQIVYRCLLGSIEYKQSDHSSLEERVVAIRNEIRASVLMNATLSKV